MPNSNDFNHFSYNPTDIQIDRSMFNMDHSVKFSCNVGEVIPFEVIECVPGDSWSVDTSKVVRLQPLVAPIMDEVILDVYYFFVPNRLVWSHWKEFCGENNSGPWAPSTEYSIPSMVPPEGGWNVGTIADYMGIPPKVYGDYVNALPFRAYALICNDWFRSEAVMNPVNVTTGDHVINSESGSTVYDKGSNGDNQVTSIELGGKPFIACKFFDYFTSALPSPQRGEAVNVFPSGTYAPIESLSDSYITDNGLSHSRFYPGTAVNHPSDYAPPGFTTKTGGIGTPYSKYTQLSNLSINSGSQAFSTSSPSVGGDLYPAYIYNLYARLNASTFNINDLRNSFAVQRYLEKSARYGGRYIEFVKGFFGVTSSDARLQRPEYIGGSRISLNINSVEQTSATQSGSTPLGNVAGMSVTADYNSDFTYSCEEHGYIIGCSVLRYHHSYQQGLNRMWLRSSFTDFYLPTFAFLGEQEVNLNEIYYGLNNEDNVFGYQERWAEYRYMPNRVAGEMRSVSDTSLDMWHLGDFYNSTPTLSPEWLREDKTMLDRCLAVTSEVANQAICDFYIKCKAARPLPMYSIPGMIDHY